MQEGYVRVKRKVDYPKSPGKKLEEVIYGICGVILLSSLGVLVYKTIDHMKDNLKKTETALVQTENQLVKIVEKYNAKIEDYDYLENEYLKLNNNLRGYENAFEHMLSAEDKLKNYCSLAELDNIVDGLLKQKEILRMSDLNKSILNKVFERDLKQVEKYCAGRWYSEIDKLIGKTGYEKLNKNCESEAEKEKLWNSIAEDIYTNLLIDGAKNKQWCAVEKQKIHRFMLICQGLNDPSGKNNGPKQWQNESPGVAALISDFNNFKNSPISSQLYEQQRKGDFIAEYKLLTNYSAGKDSK